MARQAVTQEREVEAKYADPEIVEEAAADWTVGQVRCRSYNNHAWEPNAVVRRHDCYLVRQRCRRCKNEREQELDHYGYPITGWRTDYRKGYLLPPGSGRVQEDGRARLRLLDLERLPIIELEEGDE